MSDTPDARTTLLSSNTTLMWRVFVPVFFTVFLLGLNLAFWLTPEETLYLSFPVLWIRLPLVLLLLGWLWFVRRTIWRLHRVDADPGHVFISNYWTTVRYAWSDVERLESKSRLGRRIVNLWLRAPGRFGRKISFLPGSRYRAWMQEHQASLLS